MKYRVIAWVTALSLSAALPAGAQSVTPSDLSAASLLPVAVSVAAPSMLLTGGIVLSIVAVEASAEGTVWVLERASDGARMSLRFAGKLVAGPALVAGTTIAVSVIGSGHVLSAAGRAIAFVPNEIGASLLYNEQITRR